MSHRILVCKDSRVANYFQTNSSVTYLYSFQLPFYNDRVCFREEIKKMWRRLIAIFRHLSSAVAVVREWDIARACPALKDTYAGYLVSICRLHDHQFDRFF